MYVPLVVTLLQAVGGATQAAAPQVISVLVMPIQATGNVPPDLAAQFTAWFTAEAAAVPGYRVVAYSDVQGALSQEQTLQLAGCNESGCAAELAGALNTDEVVFGTLGQVGESYTVTLTRVRSRDALVPGRLVERIPRRRPEDVLDRVPVLVQRLLVTGGSSTQASLPPNPSQATPGRNLLVLRGLGGGVSVLCALMVVAGLGLLTGGAGVLGFDAWQSTSSRHAVTWLASVLSYSAVAVGAGLLPLAALGGGGAALLFGASAVLQ